MNYQIMYDNRMDCYVAIPNDDGEDALTLPGDTFDDALAFAERTGLRIKLSPWQNWYKHAEADVAL